MKRAVIASAIGLVLAATASFAAAPSLSPQQVKGLVDGKIKTWLSNPVVIDSIKAQNKRNAKLVQADINRLDKEWRTEVKGGDRHLINATLGNALSAYLKKVKRQAGGLYAEIFVMDDRGLNVGQSDVTSDYWQGDEAKWQKTYLVGPHAMNVSKIEFDESSQTFESQISLPVVDPATHAVIGAVTVGINVAKLAD